MLAAECRAARGRVKAAVERVAILPAHTSAGVGVKARVWTGRDRGDFGTMWEVEPPPLLKGLVEAALALGAALKYEPPRCG